ncbi:hypothetical protein BB558_000231 [Smittium angustum]|uniref:Uncharacterized protein n=1 Tax=Smittium angustum TaxID=133377 RepID=A0A2U1JEZ3_SMIAN|nr:hypothetical protein BB558_000231 [Smittium angustum]
MTCPDSIDSTLQTKPETSNTNNSTERVVSQSEKGDITNENQQKQLESNHLPEDLEFSKILSEINATEKVLDEFELRTNLVLEKIEKLLK